MIAGGLYSVIVLREKAQERVTVYTKHRLTLQAKVTKALPRAEPSGIEIPDGRPICTRHVIVFFQQAFTRT
jgi:hypothetical protein